MSDKPILFSAPMTRALLGGTKTQTRRVIMPQPKRFTPEYERQWHANAIPSGRHEGRPREWTWWEGPPHGQSLYHRADVAYAPGDRLWVRESWSHTGQGVWTIASARMSGRGGAIYAADARAEGVKFWPSIHMPREFSRLTLIVEAVKVERLQEISEADARKEGPRPLPMQSEDDPSAWWEVEPGLHQGRSARDSFRKLWNSINGPDAWAANPWVAAYSFRLIPANIDQVKP